MSLQSQSQPGIPDATARVARAAFKKGNLYLRIRDSLGTIFTDDQFKQLFSNRGQPAEAPWRLALVTIFQFLENLTDRHKRTCTRKPQMPSGADSIRSHLCELEICPCPGVGRCWL